MVGKKKRATLLLPLSLVLLFPGCFDRHDEKNLKIVSLVPSSTEILYAIGAGELVVGVSEQCDYPEDVKHKKHVGGFAFPDFERIVSLKPDLVILSHGLHNELADELEEYGVDVYLSHIESIEDIFKEIEYLGRVTGHRKEASRLVDSLRNEVLSFKMTPMDRKRVYVELNASPLISVGGGSYIDDMLRVAGGINIFGDRREAYPIVEQEEVIERNPDLILVMYPCDRKSVLERVGWSGVEAVKRGNVYVLGSNDYILRPGPRFVRGIEILKSILNKS